MENKFKTVLVDFEGDCVYPNYDEARQFYADINDVDLRWVVELSALEAANADAEKVQQSLMKCIEILEEKNKKLSDDLETVKQQAMKFSGQVWDLKAINAELESEISALKIDNQRTIDIGVNMQRKINDRVEAEIARLREALEFIQHECMNDDICPTREQMKIKARESLKTNAR